jgi:hypothetical protein
MGKGGGEEEVVQAERCPHSYDDPMQGGGELRHAPAIFGEHQRCRIPGDRCPLDRTTPQSSGWRPDSGTDMLWPLLDEVRPIPPHPATLDQ